MRVAAGRRRKDGRICPVESSGRGLVPSHSSSSSSSCSAAAVQVEARSRPVEARGGPWRCAWLQDGGARTADFAPCEGIGRRLVPSHSNNSSAPAALWRAPREQTGPPPPGAGPPRAAAGVAASTTPGVVWRTAPPPYLLCVRRQHTRPLACGPPAGPFVTSPCASRRRRVVVDALLAEAPETGCVVGGALPSPGLGPRTTRQEAAPLLRADPHTCGVHFSRVLLSHAESVNLEVVS